MRVILCGRCSIWPCWRVTSGAPRIVNTVSYVTRINHEVHFSWQAQHSVKFGVIAGARNVVFFNTKCSWLVVGVKSNVGCEAGCG